MSYSYVIFLLLCQACLFLRPAAARVSDGTMRCCDGGAAWSPSSAAADWLAARGVDPLAAADAQLRSVRRTPAVAAGCGDHGGGAAPTLAATLVKVPLRRLWRMYHFADCDGCVMDTVSPAAANGDMDVI